MSCKICQQHSLLCTQTHHLTPVLCSSDLRISWLTFFIRGKMMYNDICHSIPVGIAIFVKSMDRTQDHLIKADRAILTTNCLENQYSFN